jgi:hypothetical protein
MKSLQTEIYTSELLATFWEDPIPHPRTSVANHITKHGRRCDKRRRCDEVERPNHDIELNHVRPKDEIIQRLADILRVMRLPRARLCFCLPSLFPFFAEARSDVERNRQLYPFDIDPNTAGSRDCRGGHRCSLLPYDGER